MIRGWFVGNFEPSCLKTLECEVAVKKYIKGDHEEWHFHKIATEITVILGGEAQVNGVVFSDGDIIRLEPGEGADFKAITDLTTVVVKIPGAPNDKYKLGEI